MKYIATFIIAAAIGAQLEPAHVTVGNGPCAIKVATEHYAEHIGAARQHVAMCEGVS